MKILHLSSEKSWRGGEQQIAYLVEELQQRGIENHLAVRKGSPFADLCQERAWSHTLLPFQGSFDQHTIRGLGRLMKHGRIDLMHLHTPRGQAQGVLAHYLYRSRQPLVLTRRVDFVPKNKAFTRWKYNYPGIKKIVAISDTIGTIMKGYVQEPDKVVTVHSGINPDRFAVEYTPGSLHDELGLTKALPLIGNTSALSDHKDYFTFLDTAAELTRQGLKAHFVIMGEGELRQTLEAYRHKQNLDEQVTFLGFRKDLPSLLPQLAVFLMTSKLEGLGTSVLDAFAAQVPVVATTGGGIGEMVKNEETGLTAGIKQPQQLAQQVMRVLTDPEYAQQLTIRAHELLHAKFTKARMAEGNLAIYQKVLGK